MKTKSNIQVPKGATHAILRKGETHGELDMETFALQALADLQDMGDTLEFVKRTGKGKRAKTVSLGTVVLVNDGATEATPENVQADMQRATGTAPEQDNRKSETIPDYVRLSRDSSAWNALSVGEGEVQTLQDNALTAYNVLPVALTLPNGRKSKYQTLICSDNQLEVGRAFNPKTYTLLDNPTFLGVIGEIMGAMEKLGLKVEIASSGTLMERERQFISIRILNAEDLKIDDKRVIKNFLNCLNSIPSNAGCTVTFANNCFVVCCRNTFAHALRKTDDTPFHAAIKHTKGLRPMLKDVPIMVESYMSGNQKLLKQLKAFVSVGVDTTLAEQVFAAFIAREGKNRLPNSPKDIAKLTPEKFMELAGFAKSDLSTRSANIVERLQYMFSKGDGNKGESALDLFQAVTQYYTHESAGDSDNAMKQVQSSEIGSGSIAKADFYDTLVAMTQDTKRWQGVAKLGETILVAYRTKPAKA